MKTQITNTQLAYIAGYIDGDGCFDIRKELYKNRTNSKYPATIIISSVNPEVLYWIHSIFGGSIQHNSRIKFPGRKSIYYYHLKKTESPYLAQKIIPYLVEKIDEAKTFINFATSKSIDERNDHIKSMKILKESTNLVSPMHKIEFEALRNTIIPTEEDFAYLAGFIDAECNLGIQKYKPKGRPNYTYKILLQCNNTKAPAFKWLLQRFGGNIHFINRNEADSSRRNQLAWRLSGRALEPILSRIYVFLRHKKPVCEELIKFYATTLPNGGARHTETFRNAYSQVVEEREIIVDRIHKLNLKGTR